MNKKIIVAAALAFSFGQIAPALANKAEKVEKEGAERSKYQKPKGGSQGRKVEAKAEKGGSKGQK